MLNLALSLYSMLYELTKTTVMKKILYISLVLSVILFSCDRVPIAGFFASEVEVYVGEDIFFTNNSLDTYCYEWDFGDGSFSTVVNPVHAYLTSGEYTVVLTAFSRKGRIDKAYQTIEVLYPTTLEIEVLEYYDEYPVENASVILYPTYEDWLDETNMLVEGFTNANGKVVFSFLETKRYYIDVWENNHNNYTLADEDVGFIETDILIPGEINYFIAYVDYFSSKKSLSKRDRSVKLEPKGRKAVK